MRTTPGASLFDYLWGKLDALCSRCGHWLVNVDDGVARCRICRSLLFYEHATDAQLKWWLLDE